MIPVLERELVVRAIDSVHPRGMPEAWSAHRCQVQSHQLSQHLGQEPLVASLYMPVQVVIGWPGSPRRHLQETSLQH